LGSVSHNHAASANESKLTVVKIRTDKTGWTGWSETGTGRSGWSETGTGREIKVGASRVSGNGPVNLPPDVVVEVVGGDQLKEWLRFIYMCDFEVRFWSAFLKCDERQTKIAKERERETKRERDKERNKETKRETKERNEEIEK
jgi:hypothetical protein